MRLSLLLAGLAAAALAAPAAAQTPATGEYGEALRRMITEAAAGTCAADLMSEQLLTACTAQIAQMGAGLQSLGAVETMTFVGAQDTPTGRVERYAIKFAAGPTLTWFIGPRQADGKFASAGTGG